MDSKYACPAPPVRCRKLTFAMVKIHHSIETPFLARFENFAYLPVDSPNLSHQFAFDFFSFRTYLHHQISHYYLTCLFNMEKLNRDIPSEIHHEVKQQVHWFIVEVKKLWKEAARKQDVLAKKQKWLPTICVETDKKSTSGQLGPLRPSGPTRKTGLL